MDIEQVAAEINAHLRALPAGSKTEAVRAVRRHYSKQLAKAAAPEIVELARRLLFEHGHRKVVCPASLSARP